MQNAYLEWLAIFIVCWGECVYSRKSVGSNNSCNTLKGRIDNNLKQTKSN